MSQNRSPVQDTDDYQNLIKDMFNEKNEKRDIQIEENNNPIDEVEKSGL